MFSMSQGSDGSKLVSMKRLVSFFALVSVFAFGEAYGLDTEARVRMLLLGPDGVPTRALLEGVSPDAKIILLRMATEAHAPPFIRDRALVALGDFGGDDVEVLFQQVLSAPATHEITQHKVLLAYARAFRARALPALARGLSDPRPAIRLTAIEALDTLGDPRARRMLEEASSHERVSTVRLAIARALKR